MKHWDSLRKEVVGALSLEVFKARLYWGFEQPGLVEDVPVYGRMVGLDDLQGPCGRKITLSHSFTGYSSASENLLQFFYFNKSNLNVKNFCRMTI